MTLSTDGKMRRRVVQLGLALAATGGAALATEPPADDPTPPAGARPRRPLVDRSQVELSDGRPLTVDVSDLDPETGQREGYAVLTPEERSKGFVRPVRTTYTHLVCGTDSRMTVAIAKTFAREPRAYDLALCIRCREQFPLDQFVWKGTTEAVGA